jgi:hypothetical protein
MPSIPVLPAADRRLFGPAGAKNQPNSDSKISWLEQFQSGTNTSCQSGTGKNQAASF